MINGTAFKNIFMSIGDFLIAISSFGFVNLLQITKKAKTQ